MVFLAASCKNNNAISNENITKIEKQIAASPEDSKLYAELNKEYKKLLEDKRMPDTQREMVLEHAYKFFQNHNQNSYAIPYLMELLKNYGDHKLNERILDMITIFDTGKKDEIADVLKMIYINKFPDDKTNTDKFRAQIGNMEMNFDTFMLNLGKKIFDPITTTGKLDTKLAKDYVNNAEAFVLLNPEDKRSPEYLFKAAEIAHSLKSINKTFELYDWILDKYPNYDKAPTVLFLKGFVLSDDLKNYDEAGKVYDLFLQKYPNSDLVEHVKTLKKYLGKSDEEMLKMIEKNNK